MSKAVTKRTQSQAVQGKTAYRPIPKGLLRQLYLKEKLSTIEIGKRLGCSKKTVRLRLLEHGIPIRSLRDAFAVSPTHAKAITQPGERAINWKGGKRRSSGYIMLYRPDHPASGRSGYVMEHRLIMESVIGRHLRPDEEVHHLNEKRSDNRLENLQLMTKSEHMSHHARQRAAEGRMGFQIRRGSK